MTSALSHIGLREAARLVKSGELSPVELVTASLQRIADLNPRLNAFLTVTADQARKAALVAERRMGRRDGKGGKGPLPPLFGVPISVKDLILTRDAPTTCGSRLFGDGLPAGRDAPVVARLRRAGAILIGKTNLHECAYGVTTVNEHFGPARNPWDPTRVSGGSSGGSAVAVATGMGYGSVGSDTRGSIRIPAACCGITGLKPTFGLIPTDDVLPLAPTLDHLGPMTRGVEDAALLLGAMRGGRSAAAAYLAAADRKPRRLRIGVPEYYLRDADPEIVAAVEAAISVFRSLGADVLAVDMPALDEALEASRVIVSAEALAFHDEHLRARPEAYGPLVRSRLEAGRTLSAVDLVRAEQHRAVLTESFAELFSEVELLMGATLPVLPPPIGTTSITLGAVEVPVAEAFCRYNAPQSLVGVPSLSICGGFSRSGLPIGLQLIARWRAEERLLSAGTAFQRQTDWHTRTAGV